MSTILGWYDEGCCDVVEFLPPGMVHFQFDQYRQFVGYYRRLDRDENGYWRYAKLGMHEIQAYRKPIEIEQYHVDSCQKKYRPLQSLSFL